MSPDDIKSRVKGIAESRDDPERAHSMEDGLYRDVLRYIKSGQCDDPQYFAILALDAEKIEFSR